MKTFLKKLLHQKCDLTWSTGLSISCSTKVMQLYTVPSCGGCEELQVVEAPLKDEKIKNVEFCSWLHIYIIYWRYKRMRILNLFNSKWNFWFAKSQVQGVPFFIFIGIFIGVQQCSVVILLYTTNNIWSVLNVF